MSLLEKTSNGKPPMSEYGMQLAQTKEISRVNFNVALGPLKQFLDDPHVQDVNINPDGKIWVSKGERGKFRAPETMSTEQRQTLIGMLANRQSRSVDLLHSRLAGDLPYYRVRYQCFGPPIAEWAICLRCHALDVRPLDDADIFVEPRRGLRDAVDVVASDGLLNELKRSIARRDNIAIVGQPGAGKTSLLRSMLREAAILRPHARLVTLEDRVELQSSQDDTLQLYARVEQARPDGSRFEYGFVELLSDALRTSFDVLAFGELRDSESAIALLMALNCGTSGLAFTLHADSAYDALSRLEDLIRLGNAPVIRRTIARFVNTIVYLRKDESQRRYIAGMLRVVGVDENDEYRIQTIA